MKKTSKTLLMVAVLAAMPATAFAQSEVLAHWDFKDGYTGHSSLCPEDNGIDCVTPRKIVTEGVGYSWSTKDSEDYSRYGANCFGGWDDDDCIIFAVEFANEAVGQVKEVNFDVGNYGSYHGINQVALRIFKDGNELTSSGQFLKNFDDGSSYYPWTVSSDTTFDVSSLGITSTYGSTDEYKFAIFVTDDHYHSDARIAVDNFRVIGHVDCVPEPSSVALLGLAGMAMLLRRKR